MWLSCGNDDAKGKFITTTYFAYISCVKHYCESTTNRTQNLHIENYLVRKIESTYEFWIYLLIVTLNIFFSVLQELCFFVCNLLGHLQRRKRKRK